MSTPQLRAQLDRLVDRLRGMSLARLEARYQPEPSRTAAAIALAQRLADTAAALEEDTPVRRQVPTVSATAAGDLVAVTGGDVLAALAGREDDEQVLVAELTDAVRELRLRL